MPLSYHPHTLLRPFNRRRAFSLVELLVVIGIIGVLIAIILPAVGKVREQANSAKCAANLRQIGDAIRVYVGNYDGYVFEKKNENQWDDRTVPGKMIDPYDAHAYWGVAYAIAAGLTKESFKCPTAQLHQSFSTPGGSGNGYTTYGLNGYGYSGMSATQRKALFGDGNTTALFHYDTTKKVWYGRNLVQLRHAAQTIFAQDCYEELIDSNGDTFVKWTQWPNKPGVEFEYLRHNKAANVLFADSHVERLNRQDQAEERYYTGGEGPSSSW